MFYRTLELDPRSGQWMGDVEGLPVHTWGRTLTKVKQYAHEALATAPTPPRHVLQRSGSTGPEVDEGKSVTVSWPGG